MNTTLDPSPPALPPPLPANFIPRNYREKIRAYTTARRAFLARRALRRVVAIVLACAIAAIVADIFFETPDAARRLILGGLAIAALALLTHWWWRPAIAFGEPETIRDLEHRLPEFGQQLRTAREAENATSAAGIAGVLASGLVADTRVRIGKLDLEKLIPWDSIRRSLYLCFGLIAGFIGLFATWPDFRAGTHRLLAPGAGASFTTVTLEARSPNFTEHENPMIASVISGRHTTDATLFTREEGGPWKAGKMDRVAGPRRFMTLLLGRKQSFDYYVASGDGRSPRQHLHCLLTPRIEKAEAEIVFPDYIGEPPKKTSGGDVKAVEDSKATVTFQFNPPLTQALAQATDGHYLPLTIAGNRVILEQKLTRGDLVYQLSGTDAEGLEFPPASFKFTGVEDKAPEVELVEPKKDVEATSVWEILARLTAKDDFGIAEVGIILVVGNEIKMIAHREIAEKNVRTASEMGTAALEEFPLTINDNLKIYAFARDHKPRDGARSVSKLVSIDIRQFKTRWRAAQGGGMPMSGQQLGQLFNLIKLQRGVVSDTFVLKENGVPSGGDLGAECDKIRTREDALAEQATKLKNEVEGAGTMNADDLTMLSAAAQQMTEASGHLEQRLTRPAYKQADRALSSLLALRRLIMRLMMQSKSAMPSEAEKQSKAISLSDLAAEAKRLANEEHEVREKVTSDPLPAERELEVTRHRQEVAVTDAGELFASLVRHPGATELALQHMDEAEKRMEKSEEKMKDAAPQGAGPDLQSAEDALLNLAAQLRALDEKNMDETMKNLAQMAAEAKARMEKEQKDREASQKAKDEGENPNPANAAQGQKGQNESGQDQKAGQEKGEAAKNGNGEKSGEQARNGGGTKQGSKEGGQGGGDLDKTADQAATIDDTLKALAGREGTGDEGSRLGELREKSNSGELKREVQGLKEERDDAKAAGKAGELGNRFGQLGDGLRAEQRHLLQSRVERLTELLDQTKKFQKDEGKIGDRTGPRNPQNADNKPAQTGSPDTEKSRGGKQRAKAGDPKTGNHGGSPGGYSENDAAYLKDLERLSDEVIRGLIPPLAEDLKRAGFETSHLQPLAERLAKILDALVKANPSEQRGTGVPDEYSHLVDEYFRALSEDFGSDARTPEPSPRRE